jgi:hypothetical protein
MVLSGKNQNEPDDCGADILKGGAVLRLQGVSTRITISLARMTVYGTDRRFAALQQSFRKLRGKQPCLSEACLVSGWHRADHFRAALFCRFSREEPTFSGYGREGRS